LSSYVNLGSLHVVWELRVGREVIVSFLSSLPFTLNSPKFDLEHTRRLVNAVKPSKPRSHGALLLLLPPLLLNSPSLLCLLPQPSHISKLPVEVIIHIIDLAKQQHDQDLQSYEQALLPSTPRINPVLALSHVCRLFNSAATSTSTLWTSLYLDGELNGTRAEEKALFWSGKASQRVNRTQGRTERGSGGITTLVFTRIQHWTDDYLSLLCESLDLLQQVRLQRCFLTWTGTSASSDESQQLQNVFRLVKSSSSTLLHLTLYTSAHLRILFSLSRLGHTFNGLTTVDIRSCNMKYPSTDAYLLPVFLPRFEGERDWHPLSKLSTLILVHPIWRLRFRDGTVASPTIDPADVPALRIARLGPTTPPVSWNLFSSSSITDLTIEDQLDHPRQEDPDLSTSFPALKSLSMIRSQSLTTRFLDLAIKLELNFPHLTRLDLNSATLSQSFLDLFSSSRAPLLDSLRLDNTTSTTGSALSIPLFEAVRVLSVLGVNWLSTDFLKGVGQTMPRLEHLHASIWDVEKDLVDLPKTVALHYD